VSRHRPQPEPEPPEALAGPRQGEATIDLLARAREGDAGAADALFSRYLPLLRRWARGRLPRYAREVEDTDDLVQETLYQTFRHLDHFEQRRQGALHAYLRQALLNRIRDLIRRAARHPHSEAFDPGHQDRGASPLEQAIGQESLARYEQALAGLRDEERELIVARLEIGLPFAEIARLTGRPSADAARMAVARALLRLAHQMGQA
jgi:RNA polymerase sigma-70 factor (ECF subfamily)